MNILILGGSGLLGSRIASEGLGRGHRVTSLARGKSGAGNAVSENLSHVQADIYQSDEKRLGDIISGHDCLVYAFGIDDRHVYKKPAYRAFHEDHVEHCLRILKIAKAAGVKKFLVLGSYFTHLADNFPELRLGEHHPYIRTRLEQRAAVLAETAPGFDSFVLELPYILGTQAGNVPPWTFLFSMLAGRGKSSFFFTQGGTAATGAGQVAQAAIGALERGTGGRAYPIGGKNYGWTDFAKQYFAATGRQKKLIGLPIAMFKLFGFFSKAWLGLRGKERGLDIGKYAAVQYMDAFIEPEESMRALGFGHIDYDAELAKVIEAWQALRAAPGNA